MGPILAFYKLPFGLLFVFVSSTRASLPYTPTRLFASSGRNGNQIYILEPPSPSAPKGRLQRLSQASVLRSNKLPVTTISSSLPFLQQDPDTSFTSVISSNGSLSVYAGDCANGGQGSSLWQFVPDGDGGVWNQHSYNIGDMGDSLALAGANYLASGISFSTIENQSPNFYVFGGMCPAPALSASGTWTSDANYSNQLLVFQTDAQSQKYDFTLTPGHASPTPEAGFTITPLQPTYSRSQDGSRTMQQDFVLVGGHTQTAFIDMNMIALFSLPQSSWTFVSVKPSSGKTDLLASRDAHYVDARSGHTAVLSSDGQYVIIFGGWVGDVSTPAMPQLLVLQVGAGYGGSGSWSWSSWSSVPFSKGEGLYGHGAVMLPGNVMLVTGGYSISGSSASSRFKRTVQTRNTQNYFLSTSSGRWIKSYDMSKALSSVDGSNQDSGLLDSNNEKAGLGAGLGLGLIALICIIFFAVCYRRRMKQRRLEFVDDADQTHEKEIDDLATTATQYSAYQDLGRSSIDGRGGSFNASGIWDGRRRPHQQGSSPAYGNYGSGMREAERSGVDLNIPSPQRGLRHSVARRPVAYHSTPRYDDSRYQWSSGDMHAIEEKDEENSSNEASRQPSVAHTRPEVAMVNDRDDADPFRDPDPEPNETDHALHRTPTQIFRPAPENLSPAEERQREMSGWIRDWAAADAVSRNNTTSTNAGRYSPNKSGRSSPSKSERTESNLSDKSTRSNLSVVSSTAFISGGQAGPSRNTSSRSIIRSYLPNILPAMITNPFASPIPSPTNEVPPDDSTRRLINGGEVGQATRPRAGSNSGGDVSTERADSFATAKTTFSHLQAENERLLGAHPNLHPDTQPTFTRTNGNARGGGRPSVIGGWVGSVKRVAGRALTATVTGRATSLTNEAIRSRGVIGADGYYQYTPTSSPAKSEHDDKQGNRSNSSSPSKGKRKSLPAEQDRIAVLDHEAKEEVEDVNAGMRRSVSDGAAFWAAKRGAKDWEIDANPLPQLSAMPKGLDSELMVAPLRKSTQQNSSAGLGWRTEGAWRVDAATATGVSTTKTALLSPTARSTSGGGQTGDAASDWDVEAAIEQRVVQVMFTVPREKLRVVNADIDVASLVSTLREDEEWKEANRPPSGERIWDLGDASNTIVEEDVEVHENGNTKAKDAGAAGGEDY